MKSMVVLFALAAVACGSLVPLAQPAHHPALVLDPHGRPLDTAEVINARAIHLQAKALEHSVPLVHAAHAVVAAPVAHALPAAVSHQSRVDVRTSPAVIAHAPVVAAPVLAHSALGYAGHGLTGHGHWLKKRSLGHYAYSAPIVAAPAAVSHQSRVDVVSSPAIVSHAVAPVVAHATPVYAHAAPVVAHVAPAAVSHQSRVDVRTSPAVVAHSVVAAPVAVAHSVAVPHSTYSVWGAHAGLGLSHGHYLHKRSLGHALWAPVAHAYPAAVSHQSRVDVRTSPAVVGHAVAPVVAAPLAVAHVGPAAVSHQSRVDVVSSAHVAPIVHSAVWTAPISHLSHSGLLHSSPLVHGAHW